jgi:predicted tellurium resistance membrane protein TerC
MLNNKQNKDTLGFLLMLFLVLIGFKMSGSVITENWLWWVVAVALFVYLIYKFAVLNKMQHHHALYKETSKH